MKKVIELMKLENEFGQESANFGQSTKTRWVQGMARDVGIEPTRPFDHRLSRPAPYQAWGIPHANV
jgi:hypothetical protein